MYHRILVPLDGSARAERILGHVEELALTQKSHVVFLQVVQPDILSDGYKNLAIEEIKESKAQRLDEAERYLKSVAGTFREKGIKAHSVVEVGSVVASILKVAQREASDLIAMASHGRGGLGRVFYGSVAAGILQAIDRPLLLIRSRESRE